MIASSEDGAKIRARYEELRSVHGHDIQPMLLLLDWIHEQKLEDEIFAFTSMFDLVISDRRDMQLGENTLSVSWQPQEKRMHFCYERLVESTDVVEKSVPEEQAIETLREFLAYKFGVHRTAGSAKC